VVGRLVRTARLVCVALALVALEGCGSAGPVTPTPEPMPSSAHLLSGLVGFSGASAWLLSTTELSTSDDGGRTWTAQQLPDGAGSSSIAAIARSPGRRTWLAVPGDSGIQLYSRSATATAWSNALLVPTWPSAAGSGPPSSVVIAPGPGALVAVAATIAPSGAGPFSTVFVSTDDGDTFVEHPAPTGSPANAVWSHAAFLTPQSGLVVAGESADQLIFTTDAGASWSRTSPSTLPAAGSYFFGTPVISGSDIELPVTGLVTGSNGRSGATFTLLVSHDGGATFEGPLGPTLSLATYGHTATDSLGQTTWVAPYEGGRIYETDDEGRTWTTVAASGLPSGVSRLALTGPASATALIGLAGCPGFQSDCWTRSYLLVTTDGGRTWTTP
jgi:hypothetical protein